MLKQNKIKLGLLVLAALIFVLIPTNLLDSTKPNICLFRMLCGFRCPGCGITRAVSSVCHGNLYQAYCYNKLVVFVFPLTCFIFFKKIVFLSKTLRDARYTRSSGRTGRKL